MRNFVFLAALGTFALGVAAQAHEDHQHSTNPLVDARQGGMTMLVANMGALSRAESAPEADAITRAAFPASGIAAFARSLPALFAAETKDVPGTRSLPAVWEDSEGFGSQIAEFQAATAGLEAAARTNDKAAFSESLARTKAACQSCHTAFRAEG
ncbi:cytochrome c [Erythrobacter sp. SDW2]|uniref:c-type cytochrome n=1 Tax=Erythrobacter sp. SDW2 TaxID=2907154 RepID=UPI001F19E45C|nr:cytochrome c [Erythrobacter sp. SDW2]UIP06212.1 cytochrome c [Erythrobacter sp. SDW2]